jgi:hypothetical protein
MAYGVTFDATHQEKYDRTQVVIRLVIAIILSIAGAAIGWLHGLLFLAIPVVAAILISQKGARKYLEESEQNITLWLRYIISFYSYMGLLTDKLPNQPGAVRFEVTPQGEPTAGNVLLRIILAIPSAIVLVILGIVGAVLGLIAAIMILIQESYPEGIFNFLRGCMRWESRLLVYMAGLVQDYPPFAFDTGPEPGTPALPPASGSGPQPAP